MKSLTFDSFWLTHAWIPLVAFAGAFVALDVLALDPVLARAWYFDAQAMHWLGAGSGQWWAKSLLHDGGRWLVRGIAALALAAWALSVASARLRDWSRPAGFIALSVLMSTALVGVLKAVTNVDCPWDLSGFGGQNPYVALFADRADELAPSRCFPGAHSSSGFSLTCFYFLWRDRSARLARRGLLLGIGLGAAFSVGQEARGAHFLSHDLTSAAIVWFSLLTIYCRLLRPGIRSFPHVHRNAPDSAAPHPQ